MHVLWVSDSPDLPTGFGNVTRFVCEGLVALGHQVSIIGWHVKRSFSLNGCTVYPVMRDPLGSDALSGFLSQRRCDVVVVLGDVWWLPFLAAPRLRRQMLLADIPWILYFPVDGDIGEERLPASWVDLLRHVDLPVAMSRYGQRVTQKSGISCEYIPHGVDLELFAPPHDRNEAKERIGAAGKFVILSDSRNQPRKMLPRLLDIFAEFSMDRPTTLLHLHTDPDEEWARSSGYSYDVRADVEYLGLHGRVTFTPRFRMGQGMGLPLEEVARYYQAADVHFLASTGEGFGLPTLQAAAAGAVPMAGAHSACRELVEGHGEVIEVADSVVNEFGIRRGLVDVADAVRKLALYHDDPHLLRTQSIRSRAFAESFGWPTVVKKWDALLRSIGQTPGRLGRLKAKRGGAGSRVVELLKVPGISVRARAVELGAWRPGVSPMADTAGSGLRACIPTCPPEYVIGGLRVKRRLGFFVIGPADLRAFLLLRDLFPVLTAAVLDESASDLDRHGLELVSPSDEIQVRSFIAQSVLLLNGRGELPETALILASMCGVPCIGSAEASAQTVLWADLGAEDVDDIVAQARRLLTDRIQYERAAEGARLACKRVYAPDEDALARSLPGWSSTPNPADTSR